MLCSSEHENRDGNWRTKRTTSLWIDKCRLERGCVWKLRQHQQPPCYSLTWERAATWYFCSMAFVAAAAHRTKDIPAEAHTCTHNQLSTENHVKNSEEGMSEGAEMEERQRRWARVRSTMTAGVEYQRERRKSKDKMLNGLSS